MDTIKYIGIRAHHVDCVDHNYEQNRFILKSAELIEDIFNKVLILSSKGNSPIYMSLSKEEFKNLINKENLEIMIKRKNILLFYS